MPDASTSALASSTSVRALSTVMDARRINSGGGLGFGHGEDGESAEQCGGSGGVRHTENMSACVIGPGGYAQFEPSKGPPPVVSIPNVPDLITLCRNPFHPFRSNALWFQPADQPWDGDRSPLTLAANPSRAAVKRHMRSREGPPIAVVPHSIDPLPCHRGPLVKISRTKNAKSYGALTFNIPDGAVRLTTLMTILKMSGMAETTAEDALERFLVRYEREKEKGGKGSKVSKGSSSLSAAASSAFTAAAEEYSSIIAKTSEGSEEREEALEAFALARLAEGTGWSLRWCKRIVADEYALLEPYQRANHFPGTWGIGRKDRLHKNLNAAAARFGREHYGFHPEGWLLPADAEALARDMKLRHHCPPGQPRNVYIVKRVAGARGARMHLLQKARVPKGTWIAQRYVHDPFLIDGYKFDLRIYVAVTSYNPLRVFVYEEGVVRFATSKYPKYEAAAASAGGEKNGGDGKRSGGPSFKIKDVAAHLTNYSINKKSKNYVQPLEGAGAEAQPEVANDSDSDDDDGDDDGDDGSGDESDGGGGGGPKKKQPAAASKKKAASPSGKKASTSKTVGKKKTVSAPAAKAAKRVSASSGGADDSSGSSDDDGSDDDDDDGDGDEGDKGPSNNTSAPKAVPAELGSKWVISTLRRYLEQRGVEWAPLWASIEDLIIKTLIAVEPTVDRCMRQIFPSAGAGQAPGTGGTGLGDGAAAASSRPLLPFTSGAHPAGANVPSCFELYGFDVLLREDLTPSLMEVNIMPSLESTASLLDQRVKGNMIADLLTLVGAGFSSKKAYRNRIPAGDHPYAAEVLARLQREKEAAAAALREASMDGPFGASSPLQPMGAGFGKRRSSSSTGGTSGGPRRNSGGAPAPPFASAAGAGLGGSSSSFASSSISRRAPSCSSGISGGASQSSVVPLAARRGSGGPLPSSPTAASLTAGPPRTTPRGVLGGSGRGGVGGSTTSRGGVSSVGRAGGVAPSSTVSAAATAQRSARTRGVSAPRASAAAAASAPNGSAARAGKAISARPTAATKGSASVSLPPATSATAAAGDAASTIAAAAAATSIYDLHPYFRSRTPAEVDVICTAEEELSRRQHWKRLFPSATALDTYGGFFTEKRAYNKVLSDWEKEKLLNPPSWITAAGDGAAGALGDEEGAADPSGGDGGDGDDDCDE